MQLVTIDKLVPLVKHTLECGLVPMVHASPGVGKSDVINALAKRMNLKVIDFRLSQCDPTDLNGFPTLNEDRTRSHYAPPSLFPMQGDPLPASYSGWLLFLDEMTSAPRAVQAASYKLVLDRMIGEYNLHEKVMIVGAGNLATDKAIVTTMSTAMQSRLIHFGVTPDTKTWLKWAEENDIDFRIKAFIRFRPELLHRFDPNHNDMTFPCPRTWYFLSLLIKSAKQILPNVLPLLAGTIGEGPAIEFSAFASIFLILPRIEDILANPEVTPIPVANDILYATTGLIGNSTTIENIETMMKYIVRMPIEFQVITLQTLIAKDVAFTNTKAIDKWLDKHSGELI